MLASILANANLPNSPGNYMEDFYQSFAPIWAQILGQIGQTNTGGYYGSSQSPMWAADANSFNNIMSTLMNAYLAGNSTLSALGTNTVSGNTSSGSGMGGFTILNPDFLNEPLFGGIPEHTDVNTAVAPPSTTTSTPAPTTTEDNVVQEGAYHGITNVGQPVAPAQPIGFGADFTTPVAPTGKSATKGKSGMNTKDLGVVGNIAMNMPQINTDELLRRILGA